MFRFKQKLLSYTCFFFLVSLILFSSCETTPDKLSPLPGDPTAEFPEMYVGDSWIYMQKHRIYEKGYISTERVISVAKDKSFVIESERSDNNAIIHRYFNNQYQMIKFIDFSTGNNFKVAKPNKPLNFPLFVGKKWKDNAFTGISVAGNEQLYVNSYEVIKYETINTSAGPFKAFKIHRINSSPPGSQAWTSFSWYAPEVKREIKFKWVEPGIYYDLEYELQQITLAKDDKSQGQAEQKRRTISNKLAKLKELLEKGLITQEDYNKKKAELLEKL